MTADLLVDFLPGAEAPAQARLIEALGTAIGEVDGAESPRVFMVEAPPEVAKSHLALRLRKYPGGRFAGMGREWSSVPSARSGRP